VNPEDLFENWLSFEAMFPGSFVGEEVVVCPHCKSTLVVSVDHPLSVQSYDCGKCGGHFTVDWGGNETPET